MQYSEQHPPTIMDIEASGFGIGSYPIEIGFVDSVIHRYCRLIKPITQWTHWSTSAENAHGIQREHLLKWGHSPGTVARELNAALAGKVVYSDGWVVDSTWLRVLFYAAGINTSFRLSPLEMTMTEPQMAIWDATRKELLETTTDNPRHRASNDALMIQNTWIETYRRSQ